jgi:hypothetical protein
MEDAKACPRPNKTADKALPHSEIGAIRLLAPAKLNLFLKVTGRRSDGYHEVYSLMCCIALYDRLSIIPGAAFDRLECDDPDIPCDRSNLVMRALSVFNAALEHETAITPLPVFIELNKAIPPGAGLGGGSSDAATVLKALNRYYGLPFSDPQLAEIALGLGADVPFFIFQTPALATGIGEKLVPYHHLSGASSSGKTQDFGSCIRRFESSRPSHFRHRNIVPQPGRRILITHTESVGANKAGHLNDFGFFRQLQPDFWIFAGKKICEYLNAAGRGQGQHLQRRRDPDRNR